MANKTKYGEVMKKLPIYFPESILHYARQLALRQSIPLAEFIRRAMQEKIARDLFNNQDKS